MSASRASLRRPSRRKPLAACVAAIFALSAPVAVHAGLTYTVTDCQDANVAGTLRFASNNAVSGDIIDMTGVTAATTNCVDGTGLTPPYDAVMFVSSHITLATGVTVNGPGASKLAVSALGASDRVMQSPGNMYLNNFTVKYGNKSSAGTAYGGCIYAGNGTINLTGVTADKCYAYSNSGAAKGGAIGTFIGSVYLTNSTVSHSYATSVSGTVAGGAIYSYGKTGLTGSKVKYSTATTSTGTALGGGIFATSGNGYVSLTTSGMYQTHATQTSTGATGGKANGGGIWSGKGATLDGSYVIFTNGNAQTSSASSGSLGGGIYSAGSAALANASIVALDTAYAKTGPSFGGGIYSKGFASVKYSYLEINYAGRGAGIFSAGGLTSKYNEFAYNQASSGGGAAIIVSSGNTYLRGVSVFNNVSAGGGGYAALDHFAGGTSTVTIENSTLSGNTGNGLDSLYIKAYTTKLYNSTIAYNTTGFGSGVHVKYGTNPGSTLKMYSTLMSSNSYAGTQNDFAVQAGVTVTGSNNLIRTAVATPSGTITGKCPLLYPLRFNGGIGKTHRVEVHSPATDAGINPLSLTSDERGGFIGATTPARASGPGPANASPIPDIGAFEINQDEFIFDSRFEGCP